MSTLLTPPNTKKTGLIIGLVIFATLLSCLGVYFYLLKNIDDNKIIAEEESTFGTIWVFDKEDKRCLTFTKPPTPITQSCMLISNPKKLISPYVQMFLSALFLNDNPQRILVIGLGGASTPKALNILMPNAQIDTAEINPALPKIVENNFNYKENEYNRIYIEDAAAFAEKAAPDTYDIIFIDAFNSEYIPPHLLTDKFMTDIKNMLTPNGIVAINTFTVSKSFRAESELFKRNFGQFYNLIFNTSRIMIASKGKIPDLNEIQQKAVFWKFKFMEVGVDQAALFKLFREAI